MLLTLTPQKIHKQNEGPGKSITQLTPEIGSVTRKHAISLIIPRHSLWDWHILYTVQLGWLKVGVGVNV